MRSDIVLLSIHREHAERIYAGEKRAELRKSFSQDAPSIVFLYETLPVQAITGAFLSAPPVKGPVDELVARAVELGVDKDRAYSYYGQRQTAWIIPIDCAFRFETRVTLKELENASHKFRVPQAFAYISAYEALGRNLLKQLRAEMLTSVRLALVRSQRSRDEFRELVMQSVGNCYDDIDDDFVDETLKPRESIAAAFSTEKKDVFEIRCKSLKLGYTTLTHKAFGAAKTGPTVLLERFRGLGFGDLARRLLLDRCRRQGMRKLYCTCPSNRPNVVSYLLRSGLSIEAQLSNHLSKDRDEVVFGLVLRDGGKAYTMLSDVDRELASKCHIGLLKDRKNNVHQEKAFAQSHIGKWYFEMSAGDVDRVFFGWKAHPARSLSGKPRELIAALSRKRINTLLVLTRKRSNMLKVNYISSKDSALLSESAFRFMLDKFPDVRRFYVTIPKVHSRSIVGIILAGFTFEGLLKNPFGGGDHVCLGLCR